MLLLWTSPLHFNPLIYFSKSSQSVQLSSPTDSKAVKSLRSLQVATHSCPTFCRTSSTSSTGSAILNDLNSFELLAAQLPLQRPLESFSGFTDVYRPLHGPCSYSKLLPEPNWKKLEQVGTSCWGRFCITGSSWSTARQEPLYHGSGQLSGNLQVVYKHLQTNSGYVRIHFKTNMITQYIPYVFRFWWDMELDLVHHCWPSFIQRWVRRALASWTITVLNS